MLRKLAVVLVSGILVFGASRLVFAQETGVAKEAQKAVNVGNKICPVTGNKIDEKTKVTYEYQGKIYNFCCPGCPDEFKKDPEKYIKKVNEELQAESKQERGQQEQETQTMQGQETMPQSMHEGHQH